MSLVYVDPSACIAVLAVGGYMPLVFGWVCFINHFSLAEKQ